jgi:hypothetical protein
MINDLSVERCDPNYFALHVRELKEENHALANLTVI